MRTDVDRGTAWEKYGGGVGAMLEQLYGALVVSCLASIFGGVGRQSGRGVDYNVGWPLSGSHGREQPSTQSSTPTGGEAMLMGCFSVLDGLSMLVSLHPSRTALI